MIKTIMRISSLYWYFGFPLLTWVSLTTPVLSQISVDNTTGTVIEQNGNQFDIQGGTVSGDNLFHSFSEFNLDTAQIANFLADPQILNILGRITGGDRSFIDGLLQITGSEANLYLMNPAGIIFGSNASLNVSGDFFATTATGIGFGDNNWFNAFGENDYSNLIGTPSQFAFDLTQNGIIVNEGNLTLQSGQNLTLLAGNVINTGTITAPGGNITLASVPGTSLVEISQEDHVLNLQIEPPRDENGNIIPFSPLELPELLTGVETNITTDGDTVTINDITVPLETATSIISGTLDVSSDSTAGTVNIIGNKIALIGAEINASGDTGGTVLVGGDYQGNGTIPNASRTFVDGETVINANGNLANSGGRVILWSDEVTAFYGNISATGGEGFVEVSGKEHLIFEGEVTVPQGTLLLDPRNITISNNTSTTGVNAELPDIFQDQFSGQDITIQISQLTGISADGADIILEATNNIIVTDNITWNFSYDPNSITFIADSDYDGVGSFIMDSGLILDTYGADINIEGATITTGAIHTGSDGQGGNVTLSTIDHVSSGGNITFLWIDTEGGSSAGNVTIEANGLVLGTDTGTTINAGGFNPGQVSITHDGGPDNADFVVGSATVNGTAGTIEGDTTLFNESFPTTASTSTVNPSTGISITSINSAPTVSSIPTVQTNAGETITITYDDLLGYVSDANNDNLSLTLEDIITSGTLTLNGEDITGTTGTVTLQPGDVLEYTAPADVEGTVNLFALGGSDVVSTATPQVYAAELSIPTTTTTTTTTTPTEPTVDTDTSLLCPPNCSETEQTTELVDLDSINDSPTVINLEGTVEGEFTQEYSDYWGQEPPEIPTIEDAQQILRNIEQASGVTPVLYYARFVTPGESTEEITARKQSEKEPEKNNNSQNNSQDYLELVLITAAGEPVRFPLRDVTREQVMEVAGEFRSSITNVNRPSAFVKPAQQLYDWLIAPAQEVLEEREISNIAFILDAGLRSLPMSALFDGEQFLIERYSTGLMPSLALTDTDYNRLKDAQVLAMGTETFSRVQGVELSPLPAVPLEISLITEQVWGGQSYVGDSFTEQSLLEARSQTPFGIIHLATHGDFKPGELDNSYIAFSNNLLHLGKLRDLKLYSPKVELLVLSACRTALGDLQAELGFAGLAVGSGAESALGSLWYISDQGTLGFMTTFYENLKTAPIKAEAVRQTQLAFLRGETYFDAETSELVTPNGRYPLPSDSIDFNPQNLQHPYYWSALTLIGSPW